MTDTWKTTQILPTCHQAGFAVGTQAWHPSFTTEVCPVLLAQEKTAGDGTTTTRVVPAHWGRGQEIWCPPRPTAGCTRSQPLAEAKVSKTITRATTPL